MKVRDCPKCEGCPLRQKFPDNNLCPPRMGPSLRIVVAEAPGEEESIKLEPLVGGSGRIAQSMYRKAGVNWDELTLINTINCRPPDNVFPQITRLARIALRLKVSRSSSIVSRIMSCLF